MAPRTQNTKVEQVEPDVSSDGGPLTDEQKAQANAGVNPDDVSDLLDVSAMDKTAGNTPPIMSETIEGGAYRSADGSWHDSEGRPLKAEQVSAAKAHVAEKARVAKTTDDQIEARQREQFLRRGIL